MKVINRIGPHVAFAASVGFLYFVFMLRYGWYVRPDELVILLGGFALGATILVALWFFLPSRIAIAATALAVLLFPQLFHTLSVPLNVGFLLFALINTLVLVAACEFRRRSLHKAGTSAE